MSESEVADDKTSKVELSKGVKLLRRIVIIMGFVLVFGFIALIIAAYFKFHHKPSEQMHYVAEQKVMAPATPVQLPTPAEIIPSLETPASKCIFKQSTDLALEGDIVNYSLHENILTIITAKKPQSEKTTETGFLSTLTAPKTTPSPNQIIIFDLCRGDILSRVNITE